MTRGPLTPLLAYKQFILVLLVPKGNGKSDKLPCDYHTCLPTIKDGLGAHNPEVWTDYDTVAALVAKLGPTYCAGFVLTKNDPFFCLDIDGCRVNEGNGWSATANSLCNALPGTVIEVSNSNGGLHVWGKRSAMPPHTMKNIAYRIELYTEARFIALGHSPIGEMVDDCTAIDQVAAAYFPPRQSGPGNVPEEGACAEWRGPEDDDELIRRALMSKSAAGVFGNKASFADLWEANEHVLSRAYPADASSSEPYDRSSADMGLSSHLAFWTGKNVARIERLMRRSKLVREKWDDRSDYLVDRTIRGACAMQRDVLQDKPSAVDQALALAPNSVAAAAGEMTMEMREVEGTTFLNFTEQKKLFDGCYYVMDVHRVLVPGGHLIRPDQFRARFGGYTFAIDRAATKTTRNAWEAFTESQVVRCPQVDGTCFKPNLPYGTIVRTGGRSRVNIYWPLEVPSIPGDVTPFLQHLAKLLPVKMDADYFLYFMAAIVQFPGVKFPWAPLIIGVEGNGKTLLSLCVMHAIGSRYTHWPIAGKITKQFNAWLAGKIFIAVEDIHTGADSDVLDQLKPMITSSRGYEIEAKGVDQKTDEICCNFIFNSNHKNAIRKSRNDRRIAHFHCAQQEHEDLVRDGMGPDYMIGLYHWLENEDGYAKVTHLLKTIKIPDHMNPAKGCIRAPATSSTDAAISQSLGTAEQEVLEAIEQGNAGFRDGWVSSIHLDKLLEKLGKARTISLNRRRDLMRNLGYDWHPGLGEGGRVNNVIMPDGGKPRLYIKRGHPLSGLTNAAEIARAYSAAQGVGS